MIRVSSAILAVALIAPSAVLAQQFGGAIELVGDQIAIGEGRNSTLSGIVYLFAKDGTEWVSAGELRVTQELRAPDGFGRSLAYDNSLLAVGAPLMEGGSGAVYLFEPDGLGGWDQVARLGHPGSDAEARFGSAIAWAAGSLVVSATGSGDGAIFTFTPGPDGAWQASSPLSVPDATNFGSRITANGVHLLVASPGGRGEPTTVYSFTRNEAGWQAQGTLDVDGLPERSGFGASFALRENVAFVGAPGVDARSGRVYVFDLADGSAQDEPQLTLGPPLAESNARFGASVSIRDGEMWVGAPGTQGTGTAYAYSTRDGALSTVRMLSADGLERGASLGGNVMPSRNLTVAAATGVDEGAGAAIVYERRDDGSWSQAGTLVNQSRGFPAMSGSEIHCTDGQASLFDCQDVNITAFLPISDLGGSRGTRVNDVWGWTDPETDVEYVIVGRTNGTSFVDIRDPYNPVYVGDLPKTEGTRTTIWRDMKVYANHVYVVADAAGEHGVQVFDLTRLRDYDGTPIQFEETFRYEGIHSAHNIVINEETGFAYAVGNSGGGETCGGGLHMINLENPSRPVFAGCFAEIETGRRGTGYSHDAQCVVYRGPDEDHQGKEVCFGSNETCRRKRQIRPGNHRDRLLSQRGLCPSGLVDRGSRLLLHER